ncbi:MAG: DinB family protein [Bacteroidota bacterium]
MKIEQSQLINDLIALSQQVLATTKTFKHLPYEALNFKPDHNTWSILECIEHLNRYGRFYLPEIEDQLLKSTPISKDRIFRSGFLGTYFVKLVRADNPKKMKAPREMDTTGSTLKSNVIDQFVKQLETLIILMDQSKTANLNTIKTAISLTRFVRLRLGDTLRFLVHHNERHINQAKRVMDKLEVDETFTQST